MPAPGYGPISVPAFAPGTSAGAGAGASAGVASASYGPSAPAQPASNLVRFLPDYFAIPAATEFNTLGQKASVVMEALVELPGAALVLPAGYAARLSGITLYVVNLTETSQLSFSVTVNGAPLQGYSHVQIFPGAAARLSNSFDCTVRVPVGGIVRVFYTNGDAGSYTVGASLSGWQWATTDGDRWITQGA